LEHAASCNGFEVQMTDTTSEVAVVGLQN
jgi:hypothetical protein